MTLTAGARLGSYEITGPLGAGGMGEVYKARDTRLNRIVAVKVLSSDIASSPDLRERFEREARTVASLSHPHICTVHDVGRHDDTDFIVMECCPLWLMNTVVDETAPSPITVVLNWEAALAR